jgi:hypothetical protein
VKACEHLFDAADARFLVRETWVQMQRREDPMVDEARYSCPKLYQSAGPSCSVEPTGAIAGLVVIEHMDGARDTEPCDEPADLN